MEMAKFSQLLILLQLSSITGFLSKGYNSRLNFKVRGKSKVYVGNSFGTLFQISTFGESHGEGIGVTIDGCPPKIPISCEEIQEELNRRRPGQSHLTTSRNETDQIQILSGLVDGVTSGTPIAMFVRNQDHRSSDYTSMEVKYRPSHADATYDAKYGVRSVAGGGRASARETLARVAAGAIAKKILHIYHNIEILGYVVSIQNIHAQVNKQLVTRKQIESSLVRCPNISKSNEMISLVEQTMREGDSVGGIIEVIVRGLPAGIGSPVFDKLEAKLAQACMSIPATKGFEIGSGFHGTRMFGSEHNDEFYIEEETLKVRTKSNRSGGIQGGISNGEMVVLRIGFKPTSTILKPQHTVTRDRQNTVLKGGGLNLLRKDIKPSFSLFIHT